MPALQAILLLAFPVLVIVAALRDLTTYTIPNWISLALLAAFFPAAFASGMDMTTLGLHLGLGVAALAAGVGMFALGWIGGGDAKLFAAAALWLGWSTAGTYLAITGLAGGGLAVALLMLRQPILRVMVLNGPSWFTRLAKPGENVPYGVAIAAGGLAAFPQSQLMQAFAGIF